MQRIVVALYLGLIAACAAWGQDSGIVSKVTIEGNAHVLTEAIQAVMKSQPGKPLVTAELAADKKAIDDMGFFEAVDVLARPLTGNDFEVLVRVKEYPVVKEIRITGNTVISSDQIRKVITQPVDQVLNRRNIPTTRDAIVELYLSQDYVADLEAFEPLAESPNTLNVVIREKIINSISFEGLQKTKERTIRRMFRSKPGQAFNFRKFQQDLTAMSDTQWFERIDPPIETQTPNEIGRFDYLIPVKEAQTRNLQIGLQLDPRSRLAGLIRVTDSNFMGTGQNASIGYLQPTSGGGASIDLAWTIPYLDSHNSSLGLTLYSRLYQNFSGTGFDFGSSDSPLDGQRLDERRTGGGFTYNRPLDDIMAVGLGARMERVDSRNLSEDPNNFIQQDGTVSVITLYGIRDTRDSRLEPTEGHYARLALEPGFSHITKVGGTVGEFTNLLGNKSFIRTTGEYRAYFSRRTRVDRQQLGQLPPKPVIATRLQYGSISGTVPFFEQFFVGGSDTLRGYPEQRFWGDHMLLGTVEFRYPIQKQFFAAAFADYGGAWGGYGSVGNYVQSSKPKFYLGYGLGVGFRTPLGTVRLDFAVNQDGKTRTHVLIGGGF